LRLLGGFFTADGGAGIYDLMKQGGEEEVWVEGLPKIAAKEMTVSELWKLQAARTAWTAGICEKWESMKGKSGRRIDVLLSPVTPYGGVPNGKFDHIVSKQWSRITDH